MESESFLDRRKNKDRGRWVLLDSLWGPLLVWTLLWEAGELVAGWRRANMVRELPVFKYCLKPNSPPPSGKMDSHHMAQFKCYLLQEVLPPHPLWGPRMSCTLYWDMVRIRWDSCSDHLLPPPWNFGSSPGPEYKFRFSVSSLVDPGAVHPILCASLLLAGRQEL